MEKMKILVNKKPNTATQFLVPLNNQPYGEPTNITEGVVAGEGGAGNFDPSDDYEFSGDNLFSGDNGFTGTNVFDGDTTFNGLVDFTEATLSGLKYWAFGGNNITTVGDNKLGTNNTVNLQLVTNGTTVVALPALDGSGITIGKSISNDAVTSNNIVIGSNAMNIFAAGSASSVQDNIVMGFSALQAPIANTRRNIAIGTLGLSAYKGRETVAIGN
jgi:hypothetical protein